MKVKVIPSPNIGAWSSNGIDKKIDAYVQEIYDKYGENVLHEHILISPKENVFMYHTVRVTDENELNVD